MRKKNDYLNLITKFLQRINIYFIYFEYKFIILKVAKMTVKLFFHGLFFWQLGFYLGDCNRLKNVAADKKLKNFKIKILSISIRFDYFSINVCNVLKITVEDTAKRQRQGKTKI